MLLLSFVVMGEWLRSLFSIPTVKHRTARCDLQPEALHCVFSFLSGLSPNQHRRCTTDLPPRRVRNSFPSHCFLKIQPTDHTLHPQSPQQPDATYVQWSFASGLTIGSGGLSLSHLSPTASVGKKKHFKYETLIIALGPINSLAWGIFSHTCASPIEQCLSSEFFLSPLPPFGLQALCLALLNRTPAKNRPYVENGEHSLLTKGQNGFALSMCVGPSLPTWLPCSCRLRGIVPVTPPS
jgi:hypothetical protein